MIKKILLGFLFYFLASKSFASFDIKAKTAILKDYLSGEILYEKDADLSIYPASMTKIMTSIIAFELIDNGELSMDDKFIISENAWRLSQSGYSSMFIMVGDEVSVENLLKGIIIVSGNDACVALAEGIAGSEEEFAVMMTAKAKEIGMRTVAFTGEDGGEMANYADYLVAVPSKDTPRIQEAHILIGHIICQIVEQELFGNRDNNNQ